MASVHLAIRRLMPFRAINSAYGHWACPAGPDMWIADGNLPAALESFRASLAIAQPAHQSLFTDVFRSRPLLCTIHPCIQLHACTPGGD
jgi:hypothetical protein